MSKSLKLGQVVNYSEDHVAVDKVSLENFITVDNMLPNKAGITIAVNMPPKGSTLPVYKKGNILVGNIRPYLKKIWFSDKSGGAAADVLIFSVKPSFNPKYVYYAMFRDDFFSHMMRGKKGTKMPRGDKNQILEFLIPDIDYSSQEKIASVLSALDAKIELNNCIKAELESMARQYYDYWFVQFDFPNKNGKPYKSNGGVMIWNEKLKRNIPDGWKVDKINTKIKIGSGYPFDSRDYDNNGIYKIITIKNVQEGQLETNKADRIASVPIKLQSFCRLALGDVLISLTGNVGRMCFVTENNLLLNQRVGKLIAENEYVNYGYLFFSRPENRKRIEKIAGGSSQSNLSPIDAVKDLMCFPDIERLKMFNKIIDPIFTMLINCNRENQTLSGFRDWLLPMLMNGQVKVS